MIAAVREALAAVIEDFGAKELARRLDVNISTVYAWGEVDGKPLPWDRFEQIHHITNDSRPLSALCRELGGMFIPVPKDDGTDTSSSAIRALKEFADLMQESASALQDGKISAPELGRIRREGAEAQQALARYLASLERQAAGGR